MWRLSYKMLNSRSGKSKSKKVAKSRMRDCLSELPDEVLCYILSNLTLRDSVRTRLLSVRWRRLVDHRSVLNFDALNVLGSEKSYPESYDHIDRSKFVRAVDQFLEMWNGLNLSALKVRFSFGNEHASHLDRWVASGIQKEIETLELYISPIDEEYVLSDQLFHSGETFPLKCLRLENCALTFSSGCSSWINRLTTLELYRVPLSQEDLECVLCGGLNLISLGLLHCGELGFSSINIKLSRLKKLLLEDSFKEIELNCPNLELFVFQSRLKYLKFSHVPLLTKLDLGFTHDFGPPNWSLIFNDLARLAPQLQVLSLCGVSEEVQLLPSNNTMPCLKQLSITVYNRIDFDFLTITSLLSACPFLEIFHLQVITVQQACYYKQISQREYIDCPYIHLKEVKIEGFVRTCNEMQFVQYLLKNAVNLEQMVIVDDCDCPSLREEMGTTSNYCLLRSIGMDSATSGGSKEMGTGYCSSRIEEMATTLLQDIKTSAQLVFMTRNLGIVLTASNQVDCGMRLFSPGS